MTYKGGKIKIFYKIGFVFVMAGLSHLRIGVWLTADGITFSTVITDLIYHLIYLCDLLTHTCLVNCE
jgi:hypothetical protein